MVSYKEELASLDEESFEVISSQEAAWLWRSRSRGLRG